MKLASTSFPHHLRMPWYRYQGGHLQPVTHPPHLTGLSCPKLATVVNHRCSQCFLNKRSYSSWRLTTATNRTAKKGKRNAYGRVEANLVSTSRYFAGQLQSIEDWSEVWILGIRGPRRENTTTNKQSCRVIHGANAQQHWQINHNK